METTNLAPLDKELVTKKAKENMLDLHSEKYLTAWVNKIQYSEKLAALTKEWETFSEEIKTKVEDFKTKREQNPSGNMRPDPEVEYAVSVKLGIEALETNFNNACLEFDGYAEIIKLIKSV